MSTRCGMPALLAALAAGGVTAAEPVTAVDAELLEFLGSLDSEDEDWREYLADRPIGADAGKPADPAAGKPAPKQPQTRRPAKQEEVKKP